MGKKNPRLSLCYCRNREKERKRQMKTHLDLCLVCQAFLTSPSRLTWRRAALEHVNMEETCAWTNVWLIAQRTSRRTSLSGARGYPPTSLKQASKSGNATYGWSISLKVSAVAERLEGLWRLVCSLSPQPHQINSSPKTHINRMPWSEAFPRS